MRSLTQKYPFRRHVMSLLSFLLVFFVGAILTSSVQAATAQPKPTPRAGEHLVTIHDNGKDKGILTKASTLRDAFKTSGIRIDPNDLVEPSLDEELVATNYEVNIYRARPITIVDGSIRTKVMSAYQTPQQITEHAGITLHDEDITTTNATSDIVSEGTGVQMMIKRAAPVMFVLYGKKIQAYTQEKTVADMLKKKNVTLGKDDTLSVALTTPITTGMTVELWRNGKQTVTEDQDIAFETEKVQDADREVGYKNVQTPGENGKKTVSYEVDMKNGIEVGRKEIQSVVSKEAKKQVEVIGTKVSLPPGSHQDWMAAAGISSSDYGYVDYIVNREGSWAPCKVQGGAINCSYDGNMGYGIVQATPGSKMASAGDDWRTNPITQLRWATGYAIGRYGSWAGAYNHWVTAHSW